MPGRAGNQALGWRVATDSGPRISHDTNPGGGPLRFGRHVQVQFQLTRDPAPARPIGLLGYFFFIRPQQRKAQAARQSQGSGFEVGDEVQTVGGVIGTVLEVHGDRYTL